MRKITFFYPAASFTLAFGLLILFANSCKEPRTDYDREKEYMDTLKTKLTSLEISLNINEDELKNRIAKVNSWYVHLGDTAYDVARKMQIEMNGFKVVYQKYIDNFFIYSAALKEYKRQYNVLETKVKKQELTRSEFKKEYAKLKKLIDTALINTTQISKPVYDLEFSWKRYESTLGMK